MALSHCDDYEGDELPLSLIVCPSTLVGHWMAEIAKFFPGISVFRPMCYMGSKAQRETLMRSMDSAINVVVTSYAVLRNDADVLTKNRYRLCALDEGHLLKNHMTGTSTPPRLQAFTHVALPITRFYYCTLDSNCSSGPSASRKAPARTDWNPRTESCSRTLGNVRLLDAQLPW
jgi:SNF2-related domain